MDQGRHIDEVDEIELLLRPGREQDLKTFLLLLHPADIAELITDFDESRALRILTHIDPERAAETLSELDSEDQERILRYVKTGEIDPIVREMETDDVTDLLQELDPNTAKQVLAALPQDERQDIQKLLRYDPESAGGLMQTELVSIPLNSTVGTALEAVRQAAKDIDILSVFVVDDAGHYAGHLALQDLVFSRPEEKVEHVMEPKSVELTPDVDQEEVARIFDRYSLVELGVVDANGKLIGRITADDVHEVLVEEAEEDVLVMAGTAAEPEVIYSNRVLGIVGQRLPWLASTFVASLMAAWILSQAEIVFAAAFTLTAFVPVITGMSGNIGTQSAMIMIQGMAMGHVDRENLIQTILKDITVGGIIAITCGISASLVAGVWQGTPIIGLCVGCSLTLAMLTATLLGSTEPAILKRFGIDPAVAAGPLITSINDITGVLIYTGVSALFLRYLGLD